jgi:hypothetical protein
VRLVEVFHDDQRLAEGPDEDLDDWGVERLHQIDDVGDECALGCADV